MVSNEGQGHSSQPENYWLQCIKIWYPNLHTQTYFLPPIHFNRVPYSVENIAGEQVLVAQIPQDGPSLTSPVAKSRSQDGPSHTSTLAKSGSQDRPSHLSSLAKSGSQDRPSHLSSLAKSGSHVRPSQLSSATKSGSQDRPSQLSSLAKSGLQDRSSQLASTSKSGSQDRHSQLSSLAKSGLQDRPSQLASTTKSGSQDRPSQLSSLAKSGFQDGSSQTSIVKYGSQDSLVSYRQLLNLDYKMDQVTHQLLNLGHSQTSSCTTSFQSRSQEQLGQTTFSSLSAHIPGSQMRRNQGNLKIPPVYDTDVRDDKALERVLYCLRELADNSQPKEVMMVISQLQFGKYLGEPSYAGAVALLPRARTLPEHFRKQQYQRGDFDVLIIHRQHGLFTLEIKSVGDNFSQLKMTEQQEDDVVMKKVKEAVKQLNKAEVVLKHLTSDLVASNITKILVMPNISSGQLLRAINRNSSDREVLCQCLGVHSVDDAVKQCLLSDQLLDKRTSSDVNHTVLKDLGMWWQQVVRASGPQPLITPTTYEHLVARFCGPATTVEIHCVTAPRLDIRILGEAVSEIGERAARLVLFPQQVALLNRSPPRVFLTGPPGTGKTVVLVMQGLTWIHQGHDVHVVSTCDESRAATTVIEHQLKKTTMTKTDSLRVHRYQFDFKKEGEVEIAVRHLESLGEGRRLCVIADEAVDYRKHFKKFCNRFIRQVPGVYLWGASVRHVIRPLCLEEVMLTTPLRSPPVVVRDVMEASQIKKKEVYDYTVSDIPFPTDGPTVLRFTHRDGQSGHTEKWPRDCAICGQQIARVLTELNVGQTGRSNAPPSLQYRDVLVLCLSSPTDDRLGSDRQAITTVSGLVRGLRDRHVPVRVVEKGDEAAIRDTALCISDQVTVTNWHDVLGLERKVVVVERIGDLIESLYAMSRCTSQLVLIDC